jgi:hypothetical protein
MIPYFQRLGNRIERSWCERSYNEEVFAALAAAALEHEPAIAAVEPAAIVDWVFGPCHPFRQLSDGALFGEPPVMVYQAARFYIEVLFWLSSTPSIHQHAFSGVFQVLAGASVHSHWRFATERAINSRMLCGRLERVSTEILRPGDLRTIRAGNRLIHQLFHLEVPSVTLVVRTYQERAHLPQFDYLLPGLALDPDGRDGLRTRRVLLLEGLAGGAAGRLRGCAEKLIASGDLETIFYLFSTLARKKIDADLLAGLYDLARERHGSVVDLFAEVCERERRTQKLLALRRRIADPEARFLLALLMLLPDRDAIVETFRRQLPGSDPLAAIDRSLAGLSGKEKIGFDFDDVKRLTFRALVEGVDEEGLLERLRARFDDVDAHRDRLLQNAREMASADVFQTLFSDSPLHGRPPASAATGARAE